jgi:hypothetical protein
MQEVQVNIHNSFLCIIIQMFADLAAVAVTGITL